MLAPHGGGPMISAASSSQFRGQDTRGWFLRTTPFDKELFLEGEGSGGLGVIQMMGTLRGRWRRLL